MNNKIVIHTLQELSIVFRVHSPPIPRVYCSLIFLLYLRKTIHFSSFHNRLKNINLNLQHPVLQEKSVHRKVQLNTTVYLTIYVNDLYRTPKKKVREFPVPSRDVTTKLSLGGNNDVITELFLPRGSLVSEIPAGDGKLVNLFLR
jgi:hypothetical protein